ncbi:ribosome-recycling factor [Blattabacterium cuenoti]
MEELKDIIFSCKKEMKIIFCNLKKEINHIRLGSKSIVSFLEKIKVKYYGSFITLIEISSITIVDNMNIIVTPWDSNTTSLIDKAIINANLGFTPTNKGTSIHIHIPVLTEESRNDLVKKIKNYTDQSKILIRNIRKKYNQYLKKLNFSEDLNKIGENKIQKITNEYIEKINILFFIKEKEILTI